jgi:hypothetical protein
LGGVASAALSPWVIESGDRQGLPSFTNHVQAAAVEMAVRLGAIPID